MTTAQLQRDLTNSLADGETLVREQLRTSFRYLAEAQNYQAHDIRVIAEEVLSEIVPVDMTHRLRVVAGTRHLVN